MEKKVVQNKQVGKKKINPNNVKKVNIKMESEAENESVLDFYNSKIKKIHIIVTIVTIVLFILSFLTTFGVGGRKVSTNVEPIMGQLQYTFYYCIVTILTGIVPYFYLAIGGFAQLMPMLSDFATRYTLQRSFAITLFLGGIISCVGIALCIAVGFYYCYLTTKKRKYYNASQFSMDDVKLQLYEIRKDKEKIEEINKKKAKKMEEIQACNVKIPYLNMIILGGVAYVIQIIGLLVSKI